MELNLKPCPFCKAIDGFVIDEGHVDSDENYWVHCSFCLSSGPLSPTKWGAIALWNLGSFQVRDSEV